LAETCCVTDLQVPPRTEPTALPAPTMDLVADRAPMPPPPLRVPAVSPPSLPPLNGSPIVPPMPRFSLDEVDAASDLAEERVVVADPDTPPPGPDPSCPPIMEAAPMIALVDGDAAPFVATPTIEMPVVEAIPGASPSEPLGTPPAVAMVMPSLPSVAAAPSPSETSPGLASHHPVQAGGGLVTSLLDGQDAPAPKQQKASAGLGKTILRTVLASALAVAIGAGEQPRIVATDRPACHSIHRQRHGLPDGCRRPNSHRTS
jgi:hypothetical protein